MYVKNRCHIAITTVAGETIKFDAVNQIEIDRSIDRVGSTATIKIPTSARLVYSDERSSASVQTAKVFNRGDKVNIMLGYDNRMNEEFEGFIYRINFTSPLEIECMGYEFKLKDSLATKTFPTTSLNEVINYIISGKGIAIDGQVPDVNMINYVIPANITCLEALQQLKERYGFTMYFLKNILYVGLDFIKYQGTVKYSLGVNTPRADELKYQYAEDVKLKVKAVQINKDNTKFEAEIGDKDGEQRTLYFYSASGKSDLERMATAELQKYKYTGYTGKITTFLEPFVVAGMVADITDIKYSERGGKYEVRSVVTTFGTGGARRTVEIGKTVSA